MPWCTAISAVEQLLASSPSTLRIFLKSHRASDAATSAGRHETGHLLEIYLSGSDEERFAWARDAKRILTGAFRSYKRDHPGTSLTAGKTVSTVSTYPVVERLRTGGPAALYSESLATCAESIFDQAVGRDSFLRYVSDSIAKELA